MAQDTDAGEKTEDATPRRQEEAREKGQVPFSTELVAALTLCMALGLYMMMGGPILEILGGRVRTAFAQVSSIGLVDIDIPVANKIMSDAGEAAMDALLMFAAPLLGLTLLGAYAQIGIHLSPKALEWDLSKLNPAKGLDRLFSMRSIVRTGLASLKLIFIGLAIVVTAFRGMGALSGIDGVDLGPALQVADDLFLRSVIAALIAIVALGIIDFAFQRFQHNKDLRMSKQEIREENKNIEGDPHIKARIRQVQREMASHRMMHEVPDATVVVTNPTHYAVALKYDNSSADGGAPRVVAKGVDHVAQEIKRVARDSGVMCFEDVPLARSLHAACEIGDEVPEALFEAVASVLAYVYRVQGGSTAA